MVTRGEAGSSFSIDHLSRLPADLPPLSLPLPPAGKYALACVFVCVFVCAVIKFMAVIREEWHSEDGAHSRVC